MVYGANIPNILPDKKQVDGRGLPKTGEDYEKMITLLFEHGQYFPNNTVPPGLSTVEKYSNFGHTVVRYKGSTLASIGTSIFPEGSEQARSDIQGNTRFGSATLVSKDTVAIEDGPSAKNTKTGLVNIQTKQHCKDKDGLDICQRKVLGTGYTSIFPKHSDSSCIVYATTYDRDCKWHLVDRITNNVVYPFTYEKKTSFDFIQRDALGNVIIKDENHHIILNKNNECLYDSTIHEPKVSKHRNYEHTDSFGHFVFDNGWVLIPGIMLYNKEATQHDTLLGNIIMQNNDQSQKQIYLLDQNIYRTDPDGDSLFDDIHITKDYITIIKGNSGKILLAKNSTGSIVKQTNPLSTKKIKIVHSQYRGGKLTGFRVYDQDGKEYRYLPGEAGEWFHTRHREGGPSIQPIRYSSYCIVKNQDGKCKLTNQNLEEYPVWVSAQATGLLGQIFDAVQVHEKMSEFQGINTLSFNIEMKDGKKILHTYSKNCRPHT